MDLNKSFAFYKRFADAGGFTFVIVGVMSPEALAARRTLSRWTPGHEGQADIRRFNINSCRRGKLFWRTVYRGTEPKSAFPHHSHDARKIHGNCA